MKEKEDKKGDKVLGNEQGLTCHKFRARQGSELGSSVAYFTFGFEITVVGEALQFVEGTLKSQW